VPAALAALVVTGDDAGTSQPVRHGREIGDWAAGDRGFAGLVRSIDRLRLARAGPVAHLLRVSLFRALASSPAALLAGLGRYRRLLDHAAAARRAGHPVSRALIRSVTGADPEQLILWEVLGPEDLAADLALGDRRGAARLEQRVRRRLAGADPKLERLGRILADRQPTLLFTTSVETLHYLRRQPLGVSVAWVTGSAAGIGWMRTSRTAVLDAFDPATVRPGIAPPVLLIASDVAAEGLNLRRAGRIIHYDLPWTAVRLDQRDGRAIRQGSTHAAVEVIEFRVPAALEQRIGLESAIARKRALPGWPGWSGDGADFRTVAGEPADGAQVIAIEGPAAALAGFAVTSGTDLEQGLVLTRTGTGPWLDDPAEAHRLLQRATLGRPITLPAQAAAAIRLELDQVVAEWLRHRNGDRYSGCPIAAGARAAVAARIRDAERRRARDAVLEAERVLQFLGRGRTAGEQVIAERISANDPAAFARAAELGGAPFRGPAAAVLSGLIVFRDSGGPASLPG